MPSNRKRGKVDIIAEILKIGQKPVKKTRIMYRANLSFQQLKKYLKIVEENQLLKKDSDTYKTTEKGKRFLEIYRQIDLFLS